MYIVCFWLQPLENIQHENLHNGVAICTGEKMYSLSVLLGFFSEIMANNFLGHANDNEIS